MSEFTDKVEALNKAQQNYVNRKSEVKIYSEEEISMSAQEKIDADNVINELDDMTTQEIESANNTLPARAKLGNQRPC